MTGFLSVIMLVPAEGKGSKKADPFLYTRKLINLDDVVEIAEGRQLRDEEMNRDFETVYIFTKDGSEFEIDATFDLVEKAVYTITEGAVAKIDPLANDAVNEPIDGINAAETVSNARETETVGAITGGEETPTTEKMTPPVPGGGGRNRSR